MKVLGIVAEYNPFHNGHIYHIEQSKLLTGSDAVICVMSGNFIQRGEPALINKFARTEIALQSGVDLVIELPAPFAMSSAENFGYGAVKILDGIGIVDCISFGSEHGDIDALRQISDILADEPQQYKEELKKQLSSGLSYPAGRQIAMQKYLEAMQPKNTSLSNPAAVLETSNNILGIEYLKALKRLGSPIKPYTVKRVSNQYNSSGLTGTISSATSIRNSIHKSNKQDTLFAHDALAMAVPPQTKAVIEREIEHGRGPNSIFNYETIIFALLRQMTHEQLRRIPDVSEGLEYRIKNACENSGCLDELFSNICTKRYTRTRIQRIINSLLTGVTKNDMELFMQYGGSQYARILGFNKIGRELLSKIKRNSSLPLITKTSDFKKSCNPLLTRMLQIESQATDLYVLGYKNPAFKKAGQEYTQNLVILK